MSVSVQSAFLSLIHLFTQLINVSASAVHILGALLTKPNPVQTLLLRSLLSHGVL